MSLSPLYNALAHIHLSNRIMDRFSSTVQEEIETDRHCRLQQFDSTNTHSGIINGGNKSCADVQKMIKPGLSIHHSTEACMQLHTLTQNLLKAVNYDVH